MELTKEQLEKKVEELNEKVHEIYEQSLSMPFPEGWEFYKNHTVLKECIDAERELKLIQDYELEPLDNIGHLIPFNEFIDDCQFGGFIDSEGFGVYANKTQQSNIEINPSDITSGKFRKDFTHVMWYNK